jgi:hypothetical protein
MLPRAWTRSWDRVYCCPTAAKPPVERAGHSTFLRYLQVKRRADERTRTAYPCSLRVNCSYLTILCFILLDNRRYQRERRSVMQCNERLAVNSAPIPYRGLGIALRFTSKSCKRRADERTRTTFLVIASALLTREGAASAVRLGGRGVRPGDPTHEVRCLGSPCMGIGTLTLTGRRRQGSIPLH